MLIYMWAQNTDVNTQHDHLCAHNANMWAQNTDLCASNC